MFEFPVPSYDSFYWKCYPPDVQHNGQQYCNTLQHTATHCNTATPLMSSTTDNTVLQINISEFLVWVVAEYLLFYRSLLQKRPIILWILLTVATPYLAVQIHMANVVRLEFAPRNLSFSSWRVFWGGYFERNVWCVRWVVHVNRWCWCIYTTFWQDELQWVAVSCSESQWVAVSRSESQSVAVRCSPLQSVAVRCSQLPHIHKMKWYIFVVDARIYIFI